MYHYTHTITKKYSFAICIASFVVVMQGSPVRFPVDAQIIGNTI